MRLLPVRRDPYWGDDGKAARRRRRWHGFVAFLAFIAATIALAAAIVVWLSFMGITPASFRVGSVPLVAGDLDTQAGVLTTGLGTVLLFSSLVTTAVIAGKVLRREA